MLGDADEVAAAEAEAPRVRLSIAFLAFTALGALRLTSFYLDDLTRSVPDTFGRRLLEETTGAYAALLLFPLVAAVERRFPLTRGGWRRNWPMHVAGFLAFSVLHTTLMAASRFTLSPLLGLGAYDYGRMPVRYFMEASVHVIGYMMVVGVLTAMRVQNHLRLRELRAAALERDAATARLEALSLRLQPHFLFNALNTISSTVYEDPVAADEMIGRLGDLLRHALRTTERQETSVTEELATLGAYLMFIDARFGDRLRVDVDADPAANHLAVPAFLLQPLVENAVRHGTMSEARESHIRVVIRRHEGVLQLTVDNDLDGEPLEPLPVGTGLGTTRDRLRLLYGGAATLGTSSEGGRFTVTIRIPARIVAPAPEPTRDGELASAHR